MLVPISGVLGVLLLWYLQSRLTDHRQRGGS
jgi:hypothetical protein